MPTDSWLRENPDNRYWFTRVYSHVTENELQSADNRTFISSYVMARALLDQIYEDNIKAADAG